MAHLSIAFTADASLLENHRAQRIMLLSGTPIAVCRKPSQHEGCISLFVTDNRASRVHMIFRPGGKEGTRWGVEDEGSTNGTYLNGERLPPKQWKGLKEGDSITVGKGSALRWDCLLYTSPSPRDRQKSRMPSSA